MKRLGRIAFALAFMAFILTGPAFASSFIELIGNCRYDFNGPNITLSAEKIRNNEPRGSKSGTLRLALWATNSPYAGGRIQGYRLADVNLGVLNGQYDFNNVVRTTNLRRPPNGYYYITMCVTEFSNGAHRIVNYRNFPRKQNF